jgi:hypothetical protein
MAFVGSECVQGNIPSVGNALLAVRAPRFELATQNPERHGGRSLQILNQSLLATFGGNHLRQNVQFLLGIE